MIDDIVLFTQLVENGSFTKTAEIVHLSQATLSKRIINLETQLNKRLFIRDTRNLLLTKEGLIVYEKFKHLRKDIKDIICQINTSPHSKNIKELKVSLPTALSYELICPFLNQYLNKHPETKIQLFFQAQDYLFREEFFDVILTHYDIQLENYYQRFLRRETGQFFCTPNYAKKYGVPQSIHDLEEREIIGTLDPHSANPDDYLTLTNCYNNNKVLFNNNNMSKIKTNSAIHTKKIGMNLDIIFACWTYLCEDDIMRGNLITVLPEYKNISLSFYLLTKRNSFDATYDFNEFLAECLSQNPNR